MDQEQGKLEKELRVRIGSGCGTALHKDKAAVLMLTLGHMGQQNSALFSEKCCLFWSGVQCLEK